ncbi:MAG TPA: tRNA glutamyl-Q(34) synthetase GluQRS [Burkholderiales bacterium]|nr:tRNA glutamyl-Q(34) synthetase GluQRS [Burkholderiales bacterium]
MNQYRGRFAPSPTGPMHFGSLVAAVGSYLEAKTRGGLWLLRMEDLDTPREQPGAADAILRTLEACGMGWDGEPIYQSRRSEAYRAALARLEAQGLVYACGCSRREIADSGLGPDGALIYPGTCRNGLAPGKAARATRVRVDHEAIEFEDLIQGKLSQDLAAEVGDFVLRRADGLHAYQLAVVVDDGEQEITDVVRGADLLDSTPRQIYLQRLLGLPTPRYLHLPAAVNAVGEKLSKQTLAPPVDARDPVPALARVMDFLGQAPPAQLGRASLAEFWHWALAHWDAQHIPRRRSLPAP